ncbi:MAG: DUF1801 domain-containing protein [Colwellia polaris]|jgi:hypothetical protein|uniref:DUF1801 domain-containing protein n=1 Tax=Colwellia polaris TaxID=326537 RepID=UPI000A16F1E7|nr:DUF1801 domain-containing protein [Colwellia polaris]|tara:strand:+ start:14174 stop:14572 length:399 start_codon:yes stop_codon:yes gene_type:complete
MNSVENFITDIEHVEKRNDALTLLALLSKASGYPAVLQGSIIGFGQYHYKYESGREGYAAVIAFAPRKQRLVVYIMNGFSEYEKLLEKLGKYKVGKSCLYINKLKDVDLDVLLEISTLSVRAMQQKYRCSDK